MNGRSLRAAVAGFFLEPLDGTHPTAASGDSGLGRPQVAALRARDEGEGGVPAARAAAGSVALGRRPVVVLAGTARGCGVTTVARGLAAVMAARCPTGAAAVTADSPATARASAAANRLARSLARSLIPEPQSLGRLCLLTAAEPMQAAAAVAGAVTLVIDASEPSGGSRAAACADAVVLVGTPSGEPALARVLAEALGRVGPRPLVVVNRAGADPGRWEGTCDLRLPEARIGARLAAAGRAPGGALGRALEELAGAVEAPG